MAALVDEAHREHLKVAAHAIDASSIQVAIDAGVNSIEHGNEVTEAQLALMRDKGIFFDFTPTTADGQWIGIHEGIALSPAYRAQLTARDVVRRKEYAALVQRVLKSGVKFAIGSDMCFYFPGKTRGEASATIFAGLSKAGMPQSRSFAGSRPMPRRCSGGRTASAPSSTASSPISSLSPAIHSPTSPSWSESGS